MSNTFFQGELSPPCAPWLRACSEVAISATLNQGGRPIALMSRSLSKSELHYLAVAKEATGIIEAAMKWHHFLTGRHFTIVEDQKWVSFAFDNRKLTKVMNNKIQCWQLELASYSYDIRYRPGRENNAPDVLTRASCSAAPVGNLDMLHRDLCRPDVTRMLHFVRSKNLPFSRGREESLLTVQHLRWTKLQFYCSEMGTLIKTTKPFEASQFKFWRSTTISDTKHVLSGGSQWMYLMYLFNDNLATGGSLTGAILSCQVELW